MGRRRVALEGGSILSIIGGGWGGRWEVIGEVDGRWWEVEGRREVVTRVVGCMVRNAHHQTKL